MTTRSKECWAYLKQTVVKDESSQSSESQQQSDSQNAPSPLTIRRQLFQLSKHNIQVGRLQGDIKLNLPVISSKHCMLTYDADENRMTVKDTSTNGTFVNGELIGRNKTQEVFFGDNIRFGKNTNANPKKKRKNKKKAPQRSVKVPTFLIENPSDNQQNDDNADISGLSPIAKSSSQINVMDNDLDENLNHFEISFIGGKQRGKKRDVGSISPSVDDGDAAAKSNKKRRNISQDYENTVNESSTSKGSSIIVKPSNNDSTANISSTNINNISSIRESNRKLQKSNEELRQNARNANSKISALETSIVELKSKLSHTSEMMEESKTSISACNVKITKELEIAQSTSSKLELENTSLTQQNEELTKKNVAMEQQLNNALKSKNETSSTVELANKDNVKLKEELDELKTRFTKLQEINANLLVTQEKQEKDLCKRKSDMIDLETTLEDTREKRSVLERKNVELNCQLEALQEKFIQTSSEMGNLQEELASINATNDENKTQKETAESELLKVEDERNQLKLQLDNIKNKEALEKTEKDHLTASNKRYQEANENLRKQLEAIRETHGATVNQLSEMTNKYSANEKRIETMNTEMSDKTTGMQKILASVNEKYEVSNNSNKELKALNEKIEKELIDVRNKHQNTIEQWNSAKEQLDVERSRIVDTFQSLKTASNFFEQGITAMHAAKLVTEPSQLYSLASSSGSNNDSQEDLANSSPTHINNNGNDSTVMTPILNGNTQQQLTQLQQSSIQATQQADDDEEEEEEEEEEVVDDNDLTTIEEAGEFTSPPPVVKVNTAKTPTDVNQNENIDNVTLMNIDKEDNEDNNKNDNIVDESVDESSIDINIDQSSMNQQHVYQSYDNGDNDGDNDGDE